MVPRYSRPEMAAIWAPVNRYRIWFEVEALAAEGMARIGAIPRIGRPHHPRKRRPQARRHDRGRRRTDRRDRARDPPRRHRLPDLAGRGGRSRQPLRAPGHDQLRRAGHHAVGATDPGRRYSAGGHRRGDGGAEVTRPGAQIHPDHRPQPRHPRRTHHVRPEARRPLRRVRPQPRPPGRRPERRSPSRRSAARSAPSPISTHASKTTSPKSWA